MSTCHENHVKAKKPEKKKINKTEQNKNKRLTVSLIRSILKLTS